MSKKADLSRDINKHNYKRTWEYFYESKRIHKDNIEKMFKEVFLKETAEPLSSSNGCPKCGGWWEVDTSTPVGQPVCSKCGYRP